jgi:hypothetical protein
MISEGVLAGHADVGLLNNYLGVLPGVDFSPHCVRPGISQVGSEGHFGSHGRDGAG